MGNSVTVAYLILLSLLCLLVGATEADLRFQNVDRKINLNSQFSRVTEVIKLKNTGSSPASSLYICSLSKLHSNLAYMKVSDDDKAELKVSPASLADAPADATCSMVTLNKELKAGEVTQLDVLSVYTGAMTPYPQEVSQSGTQLVVYVDNVFVISPYLVSTQQTEVILASSKVESFTDESPTHKSDSKIKYGRYDSVKPFTIKELRLHFENNKPFMKVLKLTKEFEVSHWGNIYVEENYELKNNGAKHVGPFSRLKYAHSQNGKANSFRELRARLPAKANSLYYKDLIGNISTSNTRKTITETVVDFELRYPLMGGWKVDFMLGYSTPLAGFLHRLPNGKRRLSLDFSASVGDVWVDELEVKVVLPEGSSGIETGVPFEAESDVAVKYTYLDVTGRPVVVLHKRNVVPEHNVRFTVDYAFSPLSYMREPALLVTAFAAFFALVMVWNRCEFTISKDETWKKAQLREKFDSVMQKLADLMAGYLETLRQLDRAGGSIRESGDVAEATKTRGTLDAKLSELEKEVATTLKPVEDSAPRVAAEISALVASATDVKAKYLQHFKSRMELASKNTTPQEMSKKLDASSKQLVSSLKELEVDVEKVLGAY